MHIPRTPPSGPSSIIIRSTAADSDPVDPDYDCFRFRNSGFGHPSAFIIRPRLDNLNRTIP